MFALCRIIGVSKSQISSKVSGTPFGVSSTYPFCIRAISVSDTASKFIIVSDFRERSSHLIKFCCGNHNDLLIFRISGNVTFFMTGLMFSGPIVL